MKLVITHFEHIKTFAEIQSHLGMVEDYLKVFNSSYVAPVAKGNTPKCNKDSRGRHYKKGSPPSFLKRVGLRVILLKQKVKSSGEKNIA